MQLKKRKVLGGIAKFFVGACTFLLGLIFIPHIWSLIRCGGCFNDFDIGGLSVGIIGGFVLSAVSMKILFR